MISSVLGQIWNGLVTRYEPEDGSDCCGPAIEDASGPPESESEGNQR